MKRILKKIKKLNVKGFTLIEILGVIVIMGLILIVAIPTMSRMINNNNNQEYTNYYTLVEEAANVYAGKLTDQIGTSKYSGCAEISLSTLIDEGYVKSFEDKDVTCSTGVNNIRIRNDKGNITINFQLICSRDGEVEYDTGSSTNDSNTCEAYTLNEEKNIKVVLDNDESLSKETPAGSKVTYITGTNPNNYVWYSGKMWRIVSYNTSTEIVKAVTVNPITSIYYNSTGSTTFSGSDVENWLNTDFLASLKDQQNFLTSYNWNATANTNMDVDSSNSASYKKLKVGLITTYELGRIKDWYGTSSSWLLSSGAIYSKEKTIKTAAEDEIHAVRPAIVFSSDVLVYSGTGSSTNPYIVDNSSNATGKSGDLINTRYSGEYVKLNNKKYRIISVNGGVTKVIGMQSAGNKVYDTDHYDYASSDLKASLESSFISELNYITSGDYCFDTINSSNLTYRSSKCLTADRVNSLKIGLPQIGDFFTTNIPGITESYWTLNPNTEVDGNGTNYGASMNIINNDGGVATSTISDSRATVVVFYLDSDVEITGGNGTSSNPYTLTK